MMHSIDSNPFRRPPHHRPMEYIQWHEPDQLQWNACKFLSRFPEQQLLWPTSSRETCKWPLLFFCSSHALISYLTYFPVPSYLETGGPYAPPKVLFHLLRNHCDFCLSELPVTLISRHQFQSSSNVQFSS